MADKLSNSSSLSFSIEMVRGQDVETRNITFDMHDDSPATVKSRVNTFRNLLLGDFNKFIQPTGWRDNDSDEDEFTINSVKVKYIIKTETEFEFPS